MRTELAVIGGGAAGMFAAIAAAENGADVTIVERNEKFGRKLGITGKGRCNLTNNCEISDVIKNTPRNGRFLYSALSRFAPADTIEWFESRGVPLKTERGARVFPQSDRAADIVNCLRREMERVGVKILRSRATDIVAEDGQIVKVKTLSGDLECKGVILATGGESYPVTGSTGDGYNFAKRLGHNVSARRASIVPLEISAPNCSEMAGLSLKNVTLTAYNRQGVELYSEFGEMLFTHFGISGPIVLSMSAHLDDFSKGYYATIDLKPALDEQKLDARMLRDFGEHPNRTLENLLAALLPRAIIAPVLRQVGLDGSERINEVTREQRHALGAEIKAFRLEIRGARPIAEAVVTAGGVSVKEIDPKTMRSTLVERLYFAGEVIDLDAYTGGFNLQIAWSTGFVAGTAAAQEVAYL